MKDKCEVEVEERPDGWWMWRCSEHGEGAFFSKTQESAESDGNWHIQESADEA